MSQIVAINEYWEVEKREARVLQLKHFHTLAPPTTENVRDTRRIMCLFGCFEPGAHHCQLEYDYHELGAKDSVDLSPKRSEF